MNFTQALSRKTLLADGATGTMLQTMGLPIGEAPERWMFDHPEAIAELARRYAAAGSNLIYTNTFGGSRVRAEKFGLADKIVELNQRAVDLARAGIKAAGADCCVVGSIGPTGELLEPYGDLSPKVAKESFAEQAQALAAAGVDAIVCESFTDLAEAKLCLEAVQSVSKLPVMASLSFEPSGRTMMGVTPEDAVAQLTDAGAVVVGVNCSVGPEVVETVIRAMHAARPQARLLAKPNAGLPKVIGDKAVYDVKPEALAAFASRMRELGVAVVGGCCGTTPEHLTAMSKALCG